MLLATNQQMKKHYETHLSKHYSWMLGGFDKQISLNEKFFFLHKIAPVLNGIAIDLGAGCGFQSIPLAKVGFTVRAIDSDKYLLGEMAEYIMGKNLQLEIMEEDFMNFDSWVDINPELILCMGDTLTHLTDLESITELVHQAHSQLLHGGKFIISYRDLSDEINEENRFILLNSDDTKIMNCFLEYESDRVNVYDIIHEKNENNWKQHISHYQKLKVPANLLKNILMCSGFEIEYTEIKNGFHNIISIKL